MSCFSYLAELENKNATLQFQVPIYIRFVVCRIYSTCLFRTYLKYGKITLDAFSIHASSTTHVLNNVHFDHCSVTQIT